MNFEETEPVERTDETAPHPSDKTYSSLKDKELMEKKELNQERHELAQMIRSLPSPAPRPGSQGYAHYSQIQQKIKALKVRIAKRHDELMEIMKNEEKFSKEIQDKNN